MKRVVLAFFLLSSLLTGLQAQTPSPTPAPGSTAPGATPGGAVASAKRSELINFGGVASPVPYSSAEFPVWAKDLRRFEIVSIGAFPWAVFYASFAFDSCRYFTGYSCGFSFDNLSSGANPFTFVQLSQTDYNPVYAPWPFKSAASYAGTDEEKYLTIVTAVSLALVVGIVDYAILKLRERSAARNQAALRARAASSAEPVPMPTALPAPEPSASPGQAPQAENE
jgi:hypothetical protein